jgi:hypothetical protein
MALQDGAWSVREAAALALRQMGGRLPVAALAAARQDADSDVRLAAGFALRAQVVGQPLPPPPPPPPAAPLPVPGWHAAVAIISLLVLLPITLGVMLSGGNDPVVLASKVIALAIVCGTISGVNVIAHRHSQGETA